MKRLCFALLLMAVGAAAQTIQRPTDQGTITSATVPCNGTLTTGLIYAYDGAGLATESQLSVSKAYKGVQSKRDLFGGWTAITGTISTLTLNINSLSPGWISQSSSGGSGTAVIYYSLNGGSTWTNVRTDDGSGWAQQTNTISLSTAQDLTQVRVAECVSGIAVSDPTEQGGDTILMYDIWISATSSSAPAGNGSTSGLPHRGVVIVN